MFFTMLNLLGKVCVLPLGFGVLLLLLFIAYCFLFAWLSLIPIFSGHFRFMSNVWLLGLQIVINGKVWKSAGVGVLLLIVSAIFS